MICKQLTDDYDKRFVIKIPTSSNSKEGIKLTLEVFPYGRDIDIQSHHSTVLVQVSQYFSSGMHSKCQDIAGNRTCIIIVKITFVSSKTKETFSIREGRTELSSTSCEACIQINQALSHDDIFYSKTDKIQMLVEAEVCCRDKVVATMSDDPDFIDYMIINEQ